MKVAEESRPVIDAVDDDIQGAGITKIAYSEPPSRPGLSKSRPGLIRDISKAPITGVSVQEHALFVGNGSAHLVRFGIDMTVGNDDILPTILIEIGQRCSPAQVFQILD